MNKKIKTLLLSIVVLLCLFLTGCKTKVVYTYKVETGDIINIEMETTDGYKLTVEAPFRISKDGDTISKGTFITMDTYETYKDSIDTQENIKVLAEDEKDDISYIFFSYNDKEFNYLIKINDSKTGIILENSRSKEDAEKVFNILKINLKKKK